MMKRSIVPGTIVEHAVCLEASDAARDMYNKGAFGTLLLNGQLQLTFLEALYLIAKKKIAVTRRKVLSFDEVLKAARRIDKHVWVKYCVFADLRNRGYIVKTALKFGADFRVYDRGVKPGEDHAKWIVYPVTEAETLTWYEFSAHNRVAHSTKKRLLIGIVDEENAVTYYEVNWLRP